MRKKKYKPLSQIGFLKKLLSLNYYFNGYKSRFSYVFIVFNQYQCYQYSDNNHYYVYITFWNQNLIRFLYSNII